MPAQDDMQPALDALTDGAKVKKVGLGHLPNGNLDVQIILEVDAESGRHYQEELVARLDRQRSAA